MKEEKIVDGHDKEYLTGKDLSMIQNYSRPKAKEINEYIKFMQIDVDYYTISKQNLPSKYIFYMN